MKSRLGKLFWLVVLVLVMAGLCASFFPSHPDAAAQRAVSEARQSLRDQGFKTDLADFDFSTTPELRAREAILKATTLNYRSEPFRDHPNLMEITGNNSAIVVWKEASLKREYPSRPDNSDQLSWDEFRKAISINQAQVDAACDAVLSGPIGFNLNARGGVAIRLPHLAVLKNLNQTLGSRIVLDLHDGHKDNAWTNLLASTRLVTAWETEPVEISQLVRFANATLSYNATWQALQTHAWPDDKLARLQVEWAAVDFFTNLPVDIAFQRASVVAAREFDRQRSVRDDYTFMEFCEQAIHFPPAIFSELTQYWKQRDYRRHGSYEDEEALLFFYRDREVELRNAVQAATWAQMRQLPGVTNETLFQSRYSSQMQTLMILHQAGLARYRRSASFLGRAAEAEARRRILITALALERYRGKFGAYPPTLAALHPEYMKSEPLDFMDGQPLRYRLSDDGNFVLYSPRIGLRG